MYDEESTHFDVSDLNRNSFLHKISEAIATLPKDEFNVIGLDMQRQQEYEL